MQYKFKACPFCGTKPKHVRGGDDGDGFIIFCNCGACRDFVQYDLTEAWNRRPLEDALQKRIAELERTVDDLLGDLAQSDRASDAARIAELEDERDKLRAAMENIIPNCMPEDEDDAAACILRIAQEALKGAKS